MIFFDSTAILIRRRLLNISQQDLSEMVRVSQSTFHRWESGISIPNAAQLPLLAHALNVDISYFFKVANSQKKWSTS
jgi:transcriptional regulator with XRE-family HTH domain